VAAATGVTHVNARSRATTEQTIHDSRAKDMQAASAKTAIARSYRAGTRAARVDRHDAHPPGPEPIPLRTVRTPSQPRRLQSPTPREIAAAIELRSRYHYGLSANPAALSGHPAFPIPCSPTHIHFNEA